MQPVVWVEDLAFSWSAATPAVLNIPSLQVAAGERLFVSGPSGSGKSTLLSLLAGVITQRQGTLDVLGQSLAALSNTARDRFRADRIGYIFQMFNLIPYLSIVDNVTLPLSFSATRRDHVRQNHHTADGEARRLLAHLGLSGDDLLARPVTDLSVGQQQRVAAARALIGAPRLLIADEPTSALDQAHRAAFIDLLFRECAEQQTTLVFVSHDQALGATFDRRIEMADINHAPQLAA